MKIVIVYNSKDAIARINEKFPEIDLNEFKSLFKGDLQYVEFEYKDDLEKEINSMNLSDLNNTVIPIYGASHIFLNPFKINSNRVLVFVKGVLRGYCCE